MFNVDIKFAEKAFKTEKRKEERKERKEKEKMKQKYQKYQNNKNHFVRLKGKVFDIIVSKVNLSCQSITCVDYKHIMICKWQWPTGGKANLDVAGAC